MLQPDSASWFFRRFAAASAPICHYCLSGLLPNQVRQHRQLHPACTTVSRSRMTHQSIIRAWWHPPADVPVRSCRRLLLRCSSRTEAQQMQNRIAEFRQVERVEMKLHYAARVELKERSAERRVGK